MNFTVGFFTPEKHHKHIIGTSSTYGTEFLDYVKEKFGLEEEPYSRFVINSECPINNSGTVVVDVPDHLVNKVPQFRARHTIEVMVPEGFLGKYYNMDIRLVYDNKTIFGPFTKRVIDHYRVYFTFDEKALITDWIEDGCKQEWGINIEDVKKGYKYIMDFNGDVVEIKATSLGSALDKLCDMEDTWGRGVNADKVLNKIYSINTTPIDELKNE